MLKKLFKAALTASIVVGMSSAAMAYVPIGDSGLMFDWTGASGFGQYTDGGDDSAAYFKGKSEHYLSINGVKGPWQMWGQIEWDDRHQLQPPDRSTTVTDSTGDTHTQDDAMNNDIDRAQAFVKYSVTPEFAIAMGTTHTWVQYALGAGAYVKSAGHEGWDYVGYAEAPGLKFTYKVTPTITAAFAMFANPAVYISGQGEGSANALSVSGSMGAISFYAGMITETYDDFQSSADESLGNSFTSLGVKYKIADAMTVSFDYSMASMTFNVSADYKNDYTDMALQFRMGGLGPGGIIVTYATVDRAELETQYISKSARTDLGLIYELVMGPGKIQFQYMTDTTKVGEGDAVTKTYIGTAFRVSL
jgi:hypothetical protein